jgi:diguanylate cyclase (GGDEF)-like protein/PAS domain S-box-containing protein
MEKSKTRILYIEDDAGLARLLERRLRRHGYELDWASDGIAGLDRLQQQSFDVVAMDYQMPGLDGLAVLERMQKLDKPPPAIMISGAGDMDIAIAAMKAGAADYVVKTVDGDYLDLLPRAIERVLEKERLKLIAATAKQALEEKTELLTLTLSSISQGVSVFDSDLRLIAWNQLWLDLFQCPQELAVVGAPLDAFELYQPGASHDGRQPGVAQMIRRARDGRPQVGEFRLASGNIIEIRSSPMPNAGVVTAYTDITDRKLAEEEQRVSAAIFQTSAEPMLIISSTLRIERCNPAFENLLGYSRHELLDRPPQVLASDQHDEGFFEDLREDLLATGHWRGNIRNRHKDGKPLAQQVTISAIRNDDNQVAHYVAIYTDLTEQVRREEEAVHQAYHDALTGLPNRNLLGDRISHATEAAKRDNRGFAVLFLDLDGFKPINDDFGHRAGDLLLKEIAQRLTRRCRDSDTVARYGGDEFVVLLRDADNPDDAGSVAQTLIDQISRPVRIANVDHRVKASVGIALFPHHADNAAGLLKKSDEAMYQAKAAGKGCYRLYRGAGGH